MIKVIYCFWTGDEEMSQIRVDALTSMVKKCGVEIILIDKNNLNEYILPDNPLHDGYQFLTSTHKSDYLRCYFMNFYGGGYSDIKYYNNSWVDSFNDLENDVNMYALGYKEVGRGGVAYVGGVLYDILTDNWHNLIGCGSFICKPNTAFTNEWYNNLIKMMDRRYDDLKLKGDILEHTEVMGHIFHPLTLKYTRNIIHDDRVKPDFSKPYR